MLAFYQLRFPACSFLAQRPSSDRSLPCTVLSHACSGRPDRRGEDMVSETEATSRVLWMSGLLAM